MIGIFGGLLHCYQGPGGCRRQGLYFSRTEPKKPLRCLITGRGGDRPSPRAAGRNGDHQSGTDGFTLSVSHELAPKLDGAVLDFDNYNRMERFVWLGLPAVKGPSCTCLRSIGPAAGKRSLCLDDRGAGLTDL
ncbi:MAG: hypothetical protein ACHP7K_04035 [Actinomycetales bacterium]